METSTTADDLSSVLYEITEDWVWMDTTRGPVISQKILDALQERGYEVVPVDR